MSFGIKEAGINNSGKKELRTHMANGLSAVEISDAMQVELPCIVSHMKGFGADEDQIGDLTEKPENAMALQLVESKNSLSEANDQIEFLTEEVQRLAGLLEENDIDYEAEVTG